MIKKYLYALFAKANLKAKIVIILAGNTAGILTFTQAAWGSSAIEVGRIAKSVTVLITSPQSNGSGVLIQKNGNSYMVLTAAHVVLDQPKPLAITTEDGQKYQSTNISLAKEVDLAVVKFESKNSYPIVKLGDSTKAAEGATVYVAGFPLTTQVITDTIYNFTEGKVTANAARPLSYGYSLVYSNNTLPGMSGGPVFNADGELIAIHGRGDFQENSKASDINENIFVKTGFNLGITMSTVLKQSNSLGLNFPVLSPATIKTAVRVTKPIIAEPKADDYFLQGVDRFRRGDWAAAINMMDQAIQLNPKYLRAYTARGAANYMLNRLAQGLADMESVIKIAPNYATAYAGKCFLQNELEQWGQALGNCNRAIELDPKLSIAYNVRGLVNTNLKNFAPAQTDLERAIKLDPNSYYAYINLGGLYALRQNFQVALKYTRQALQVNPRSAGSLVQLGQLLIVTKDYEQAIIELNRAIAINPRISNAYESRAVAHLGLGNVNQALIDAQYAQVVAKKSPQGFIEDLSFLNQ